MEPGESLLLTSEGGRTAARRLMEREVEWIPWELWEMGNRQAKED